jgi:gamma-glutamyltranspeptidase/glutathione hydrolase
MTSPSQTRFVSRHFRSDRSPYCWRLGLGILLLVLLPQSPAQSATAENPPVTPALIDLGSRFIPEIAAGNMVVGPERLASQAGLSMLQAGGNAIDAAVATGFALAVTLPRAGNIGGGGFMLIHLAKENRQVFIDYREIAPARASRDMYLNDDGSVNEEMAYFSHAASGVPGTVAGLLYALDTYGSLPLEQVIQPAIDLAEQGFPMTVDLYADVLGAAEQLTKYPPTRTVFFAADGSIAPVGSLFKQPELAATLRRIQANGKDGFYGGETAAMIADDMAANGGLISRQDLAAYQPVERTPIRGWFRGHEIISAPPPSSGGIHLVQMLNLLAPYPLEAMGHNSAAYLHHLIESMKLAYADRSKHLGDPDQTPIPAKALISESYADERRLLIDSQRATPSSQIGPGNPGLEESKQTTHFSVADSAGNVVSNTYTLNFSYGSHIVIPGTGILMNNEMDDFAARPGFPNAYGLIQGEANAVAPGRRPLSSMSPTLVLKDGRPLLATGSPGGSVIITSVLQTVLNTIVFGLNASEAIAAPRVHHQWMPDEVAVESGISADTLGLLKAKGHALTPTTESLGRVISIRMNGQWREGYADMRLPGGFVAY